MPNDGTDTRFFETVNEIASAMAVNRRTVYEWLRSGAPGKNENGLFDLDAITAWRDANRSPPIKTDEISELEYRRKKADAELYEAKAKREAHRVLVETEDVVHLDKVDAFTSLMFTEFRRLLMRIPEEMAAGYPEELRPEIKNDIEERIKLALRSLHGYCARSMELRDGD